MDKSKVAIIGHGVGAIAALYTGLDLQAARLRARGLVEASNATITPESPQGGTASTGDAGDGSSVLAPGSAAAGDAAGPEEGKDRGREEAGLRVNSIVMLDPLLLPGLDQPPPPILVADGSARPDEVAEALDHTGWGSISKNVSEACADMMSAMRPQERRAADLSARGLLERKAGGSAVASGAGGGGLGIMRVDSFASDIPGEKRAATQRKNVPVKEKEKALLREALEEVVEFCAMRVLVVVPRERGLPEWWRQLDVPENVLQLRRYLHMWWRVIIRADPLPPPAAADDTDGTQDAAGGSAVAGRGGGGGGGGGGGVGGGEREGSGGAVKEVGAGEGAGGRVGGEKAATQYEKIRRHVVRPLERSGVVKPRVQLWADGRYALTRAREPHDKKTADEWAGGGAFVGGVMRVMSQGSGLWKWIIREGRSGDSSDADKEAPTPMPAAGVGEVVARYAGLSLERHRIVNSVVEFVCKTLDHSRKNHGEAVGSNFITSNLHFNLVGLLAFAAHTLSFALGHLVFPPQPPPPPKFSTEAGLEGARGAQGGGGGGSGGGGGMSAGESEEEEVLVLPAKMTADDIPILAAK